ncbi:MAG: type IV pilus secretin PilQ [Methylovulum sp.]|nr:type IV pilus secretin PilQ [Methylovulum sp.]
MNNKQGGIMSIKMGRPVFARIGLGLFLFIVHIAFVKAGGLAISTLDVAALGGDKLQIQLEMSGAAIAPKVFHTDNPARIALDFSGVKNGLDKKIYPVNQGAVNSIYVAEAKDRVRVVVNLFESMPFTTKVVGNKVVLTLTRSGVSQANVSKPVATKTMPSSAMATDSAIINLLPSQAISGFDFKRGDKGEGRILVSLINPNTVVNTKEEGGKVVINFANTKLPGSLAKRLDVSEFGTPVKFIDTVPSSHDTKVIVSTQNNLYDYSLFQSEGLLTIEFRPLTDAEKQAQDRTRTKYTGERLSLNFQDIEIRSVIAILAEFTGQNVVAGDDVTGTITLKLDDVPWDEALDFVMMTKQLGKFESGNVTLISPLEKIKDYKQKQQETEAVIEQLDPLSTEYIKINYAKADDFRNLLFGFDASTVGSCVRVTARDLMSTSSNVQNTNQNQNQQSQDVQKQIQSERQSKGGEEDKSDKFRLLSPRGSAVVDSRTNTLIVRETAKRLEDVKKLIHELDVPVRQVMIESRIVIADNSFAKELGVRFGVAGNSSFSTIGGGAGTQTGGAISAANNTFTTSTVSPGSINGTGGLNDALVDLATTTNPYGALGMTLARGADYVLNLELSALQDEGRGELVSNPRVMTSDRCLATIQQGQQIPYLSSSGNGGTNTVFVDAVLQLGVLPQITPEGSIIMGLYITKNTLGDVVTISGDRLIQKREVRTSVLVNDGETIVLGGIFEGEQRNTTNKVPFFADLPGIGFLFKRTNNTDKKTELLVFVTPKVVKENATID